MPHVIVKLWTGKSEEQKMRLAEKITQDVMRVLNYGEESVSVAIEEIEPQDWAEKVYKPDIVNNSEKLYKKPGYTMWRPSIRCAWNCISSGEHANGRTISLIRLAFDADL